APVMQAVRNLAAARDAPGSVVPVRSDAFHDVPVPWYSQTPEDALVIADERLAVQNDRKEMDWQSVTDLPWRDAAAERGKAIAQLLIVCQQVVHWIVQQGFPDLEALERLGVVQQDELRTLDEFVLDACGEFRAIDEHQVERIDPMVTLDLLDGACIHGRLANVLHV